MQASKAWQKTKAQAGYGCLHWPKEYGGGGFTPIERVIWNQEEGPYAVLSGPFTIGHGNVRTHSHGMGKRRTEARAPSTARLGGRYLVPTLFGACEWIGPGWFENAGDPGGRRVGVTGSSMGRKSGRAARSTPTTAFFLRAPILKSPSTRG